MLSSKVSQYVDSELPSTAKPYKDSDFTTFELTFEEFRSKIQVDTKTAKEIPGTDTYFHLLPACDNDAPKDGQKKRSQSSPQSSTPSKRARSQPTSYREDSSSEIDDDDDKVDEETSQVKIEASTEQDGNVGCIDLCGSSDGEDAVKEENETHAAAADVGYIRELEQKIEKLKSESSSRIESLESEKQALKDELERKDKELEQKDKIIAVLKRRLGA